MTETSGDRRDLPTREGYDLWSAVYDRDENPLVALEEPRMSAALGKVRGLRVLDVGCGTGRHALRLAEAGADVTGVDFSEGMLEVARRKSVERQLDLTVVRHDIARPLPFPDAGFDRVVCGLVFDHVADVRGLFAEMGRVCSPRGLVMVSVMHPAMMLLGVAARFTDPASGAKTYPASVANTISDYVMGALGAGLTIRSISEHVCDGALAARLPRAGRYVGWPMLLMMVVARS
jgi:ubiquinone/menaquinone biosynthesis C-methylase UbiE